MSKQADIIISGGGIAGLTLALLLGQAGLNIAVIEPHKPRKNTKPNGRTVALMQSSLNILKSCSGVWDKVKAQSCPMEMMRLIDISRAVKDPIEVEFPAADIGLETFGYNIPNTPLRSVLFDVICMHSNITLYESALADYQTDDAFVLATLDNGDAIKAPLIVGADGRASKVRDIAGIDVDHTIYDQAAVTFVINHSYAHNNVSSEFHKPDGPLALVPLPGNQSSVVWVENKARANEIIAMDKNAIEQNLMDKTNNLLGGMTLETEPESWPLCSIKAKSLSAPRMALVAEAAHVMSPITAQGLNLSLRDVAALAESVIDHARLGIDIGTDTVLKAYEKRRRLDVKTRVFGVDRMNKTVSSNVKAVKEIRRIGLQTLDKVPALKTLSMQIGLAPQMNMGRLARGERL